MFPLVDHQNKQAIDFNWKLASEWIYKKTQVDGHILYTYLMHNVTVVVMSYVMYRSSSAVNKKRDFNVGHNKSEKPMLRLSSKVEVHDTGFYCKKRTTNFLKDFSFIYKENRRI